nr:reverse transcriptase domain-containing protein [Tanacetum cinerariifolium]
MGKKLMMYLEEDLLTLAISMCLVVLCTFTIIDVFFLGYSPWQRHLGYSTSEDKKWKKPIMLHSVKIIKQYPNQEQKVMKSTLMKTDLSLMMNSFYQGTKHLNAQEPVYAFPNMPAYANPNPTGLFPNPLGSVTPFVHWIEDYPIPNGLKMSSHIGSYNEKGDPNNFLHLYEGAIRMQKWPNWPKDKTRYYHFQEVYGNKTNKCQELKHQIEEAVKTGQLAHLVKGVTKKRARTFDSQLGEKMKEEKPALEKNPYPYGEESWPLGEIPLEVTIAESHLTIKKSLTFVIVRSDLPHDILLGRIAMQEMGIVVSIVHGAIKFHTPNGVDVPEIYMQEFWATAYVHQLSIRFKMDTRKNIVDLEAFREMLHISPRVSGQYFDEPPFEEEILDFLRFLGHSAQIKTLSDVNVNKLFQSWRSFAAVINKCLTGKSSSFDSFRDDILFSTIKVVSRHQNTQQYGAVLPIELTNKDIRNTKAYKEYHACATGEAAPKPKTSARRKRGGSDSSTTPPSAIASPRPITTAAAASRLTAAAKGKQPARTTSPQDPSEVDRTEAEQLKIVLRRSRQETHISQHGGSSTDEGTGSKPGVSDVPSDDSEEEISWNSFDDEDVDAQDNGRDDNEGEKNDESEQRLIEKEEADELYRDVDINQGQGLQVSQDIEDSHVTLTPVIPDGQQESSSVSSFVTSMLNLISDALFRFEERVKSLEVNFLEFMQTNQFTEVVSNIPDKTILESYRDTAILKRRRGDDDDQKGPSVGSDWGSKRRREGGEPESASTPSEPVTRSESRSTTGTQSRQMSVSESAFAEEPVQTTCYMDEPLHPMFETGAEDQQIVQTSQHPEWFSQPRKPPTPDRD